MSRLPIMWMPTYTMILQLEKLSLQLCTSETKHQLMHTPKGNLQLKLQPMDLNLLLQGQQLTRSLTFIQPCNILEFPSETRAICLETTDQLLSALTSLTPPSPKDTIWHPIIDSEKQLQLNTSHSIGKMVKQHSQQTLGVCNCVAHAQAYLVLEGEAATQLKGSDRIPSTTTGEEPPSDVRNPGSARSHSMLLETSSSDRP